MGESDGCKNEKNRENPIPSNRKGGRIHMSASEKWEEIRRFLVPVVAPTILAPIIAAWLVWMLIEPSTQKGASAGELLATSSTLMFAMSAVAALVSKEMRYPMLVITIMGFFMSMMNAFSSLKAGAVPQMYMSPFLGMGLVYCAVRFLNAFPAFILLLTRGPSELQFSLHFLRPRMGKMEPRERFHEKADFPSTANGDLPNGTDPLAMSAFMLKAEDVRHLAKRGWSGKNAGAALLAALHPGHPCWPHPLDDEDSFEDTLKACAEAGMDVQAFSKEAFSALAACADERHKYPPHEKPLISPFSGVMPSTASAPRPSTIRKRAAALIAVGADPGAYFCKLSYPPDGASRIKLRELLPEVCAKAEAAEFEEEMQKRGGGGGSRKGRRI